MAPLAFFKDRATAKDSPQRVLVTLSQLFKAPPKIYKRAGEANGDTLR